MLPCRIVIETRLPVFTVTWVFPLIAPEVAVIVATPDLRAVAAPLTVIEAMLLGEELQATVLVMSCVVPSANVPVAVSCWISPIGTVLFAGVTAIEVSAALLTVRVAVPETLPEDAVMTEEPAATA